jgi:23S rRNA (pseudouridine1915-N3)-methyltransferase
MIKVKIFTIGKTKEPWLQEALEEYTKRLQPYMTIDWHLAKSDSQLSLLLEKEPSYICLDPSGRSFTSTAFSKWLYKQGSRLIFAIGGAEGFSENIRANASFLLNLSSLTFTHQLTRLILLEQLYRAVEIEKGTSYHK